MLRIGIDTGGTFTDFVLLDNESISIFKLPSTPQEPERAVLEGLYRFLQNQEDYLLHHGSTVATNSLLQRKGARTALVTNQGFEDILEIGRQNRPGLYSLAPSRPEPLVPVERRLGIKERLSWDGKTMVPLDNKSLEWLRERVVQLAPQSIAVVLLYSFVNPESEQRIRECLEDLGIPITLSHELLPEFREYERTSTTVINAYLRPVMEAYLTRLEADPIVQKGKLRVMQSNGGSTLARTASAQPVRTLFSGPAGGVVGAFELAREAGYNHIITLDMGGTSTDVSLCPGKILTTAESVVGHLPIAVQTLAIHSVGAGGGSLAWIDAGGLLRVGPQSAGADPGPACYGKGDEPTVTDANLFLGRLHPDYFLGGEMKLAPQAARQSLERLGAQLAIRTGQSWNASGVARGILKIVNAHMERALRLISLQKGYDTRDFTVVCFGGSAGLHACDLARALLIPRVLIPAHPGVLSAWGVVRSDIVKDASLSLLAKTYTPELRAQLMQRFKELEEKLEEEFSREGFPASEVTMQPSLDLRYRGQSYELNIAFGNDFITNFHKAHETAYGYSNARLPVEIVTLRLRGSARYPTPPLRRADLSSEIPQPGALMEEKQIYVEEELLPVRFYFRHRLQPGNRITGPAILIEYSATTWIPHDFNARVDGWQNLVLECSA